MARMMTAGMIGVTNTGARNGMPTIDRKATLTKNVATLNLNFTQRGALLMAFMTKLPKIIQMSAFRGSMMSQEWNVLDICQTNRPEPS